MSTTNPTTRDHEAMSAGAPSEEHRQQLARLSPQELIARYRFGIENLDRRIFEMTDAQLDTAFLPDAGVGNWPVRVLLGHLADEELASVHRVRRILAEDGPVLGVWDEDAFIDAGLYRDHAPPIGGFIATIYTLRTWNAEMLSTLNEQQWARTGMHPEYGERSIREIIEYGVWHLERHAWYCNAKAVKMLGPAPTGGCCGGAGSQGGAEGACDPGSCACKTAQSEDESKAPENSGGCCGNRGC